MTGIHCLVYSDSGGGKSTFAATFPKPLLVYCFDPFGKDHPYLRRGVVGELTEGEFGPMRRVHDDAGKLQIQIEYFFDLNPQDPTAYERFLRRLTRLEADASAFKSIGLDSVTFLELAARKFAQYKLNPNTREPRQWYSYSTESCEEILLSRFGALPNHVVVCAHVDESRTNLHGDTIRAPQAPGRLRKTLASGYGELYHLFVVRGEDHTIERWLQTQPDEEWMVSSQIDAPNPCRPSFRAMMASTEGLKHGGKRDGLRENGGTGRARR